MDVKKAVDELERSSFIEVISSKKDNELFLTVPLAAAIFSRKKLSTYAMKSAVEADLDLLYAFGASKDADIDRGIAPKVEKLYGNIARKGLTQEHLPVLEFVANKYAPAWLLLADLYLEADFEKHEKQAKNYIRRYIETSPIDIDKLSDAWEKLAILCAKTEDWVGEIQARVEMCQLPNISFSQISNSVNRVNALFTGQHFVFDSEEKKIISRKLAEVMDDRIESEGDATDCSRLGWLFIRLDEEHKAKRIVELGLKMDPNNEYCHKLLSSMNKSKY